MPKKKHGLYELTQLAISKLDAEKQQILAERLIKNSGYSCFVIEKLLNRDDYSNHWLHTYFDIVSGLILKNINYLNIDIGRNNLQKIYAKVLLLKKELEVELYGN